MRQDRFRSQLRRFSIEILQTEPVPLCPALILDFLIDFPGQIVSHIIRVSDDIMHRIVTSGFFLWVLGLSIRRNSKNEILIVFDGRWETTFSKSVDPPIVNNVHELGS